MENASAKNILINILLLPGSANEGMYLYYPLQMFTRAAGVISAPKMNGGKKS